MCLGIPGRVVSLDGDVATLDVMGEPRTARLDLLETHPLVGDYVLQHLGLVTAVLDPAEAQATLALFETILEQQDPPGVTQT